MTTYTYSSELLDEILFRAGEPTDGTSDFEDLALRVLNRAYRGIWNGGAELDPSIHETWWWLRSSTEGIITLLPQQTGTAAVLNNNTAVTLSAVLTPSIAGYRIRFNETGDVYTVSAHTAGTAAVTLDSVFTEADDATASFSAFKTDYSLATDLLYLIGPLRITRNQIDEISMVAESEMQRQWPLRSLDWGVPDRFCMIGQKTVRFNRGGGENVTDFLRVDYAYIAVPSDLTDSAVQEPLVPLEYRHILADWGTAMLLADKDDDRAPFFTQLAQRGIQAMSIEQRRRMQRSGRDFGRIKPRLNPNPFAPLKTASGIILN